MMQEQIAAGSQHYCASNDDERDPTSMCLWNSCEVGCFSGSEGLAGDDFDTTDEIGFGDGQPAGPLLFAASQGEG